MERLPPCISEFVSSSSLQRALKKDMAGYCVEWCTKGMLGGTEVARERLLHLLCDYLKGERLKIMFELQDSRSISVKSVPRLWVVLLLYLINLLTRLMHVSIQDPCHFR